MIFKKSLTTVKSDGGDPSRPEAWMELAPSWGGGDNLNRGEIIPLCLAKDISKNALML